MSTGRSCAGSALALLLGLAAEPARTCTLPRFEPVTIARTEREPVLADGRAVRLAGLTPLAASSVFPEGAARLSVLARGTDRWGRIAGVLVPGEGGWAESVNLALLRHGKAFALPGDLPADCFADARAAESEARAARRGIWAGDPVVQATDLDALRAREGRFAIVAGTVRSVRQGRRQVFLNFGTFGTERFSVAVALARLDAFKAAGIDLPGLRGRPVELRGVVGAGPSMEIQSPEALAVLRRP